MIVPASKYRPRRMRSNNPPTLQITRRDIDILRSVARYRFLNSEHITALTGGSPKNIRNRLKALFEHGYLDRPECQYDFYRPGGGSMPIVYALGDKGARLLIDAGEFSQTKAVSWSRKNSAAGRPFLEHTLGIAQFAVGLRVSLRVRSDIELLEMEDLVARFPAKTRDLAKPLRLSVPVIFNGTRDVIGLEPDYAFSRGFPELKKRANFLVEIDRGTMPIERADLKASSILRKFLAYREAWGSRLHTKQFGWQNFRVLFVTASSERVCNMQECARRSVGTTDAELFWFATNSDHAAANFHEIKWTDGTGRARSVYDTI